MDIRQLCTTYDIMKELPGDTVKRGGQRYRFLDNGASILAVAHCDVSGLVLADIGRTYQNNSRKITSPALDDRLGIYGILKLIEWGYKIDVLFTEDEEIGRSSAFQFKAPRPYNWIFSLDRHGVDAVLYQYETTQAVDMLSESGWKIGRGSYSDIADLEHLGCVGFNFGIGYYNEHTLACHATWSTVRRQISRTASFVNRWKDTKADYTRPVYHRVKHQYNDDLFLYYGTDMDDPDNPAGHVCDYCGLEELYSQISYQHVFDAFLCEYCLKLFV